MQIPTNVHRLDPSWNPNVNKVIHCFKEKYKSGTKVKSSYIYRGPTRDDMKIFANLQIKSLIDEKEISCSRRFS